MCQIKMFVTVMYVCGFVAACNSSSLPADPIKNYRLFLEGEFDRLEQDKYKVVRKSEYKLKVEKSNSLESPILGTCNVDITWLIENDDGEKILCSLRLEMTHGLQEGEWVLMAGHYKIISPELYENESDSIIWSFANITTNNEVYGSGEFQSLVGLGDVL